MSATLSYETLLNAQGPIADLDEERVEEGSTRGVRRIDQERCRILKQGMLRQDGSRPLLKLPVDNFEPLLDFAPLKLNLGQSCSDLRHTQAVFGSKSK